MMTGFKKTIAVDGTSTLVTVNDVGEYYGDLTVTNDGASATARMSSEDMRKLIHVLIDAIAAMAAEHAR